MFIETTTKIGFEMFLLWQKVVQTGDRIIWLFSNDVLSEDSGVVKDQLKNMVSSYETFVEKSIDYANAFGDNKFTDKNYDIDWVFNRGIVKITPNKSAKMSLDKCIELMHYNNTVYDGIIKQLY